MSDLISQRELAERLEVDTSALTKGRQQNRPVAGYPIHRWAETHPNGRLKGYDLPDRLRENDAADRPEGGSEASAGEQDRSREVESAISGEEDEAEAAEGASEPRENPMEAVAVIEEAVRTNPGGEDRREKLETWLEQTRSLLGRGEEWVDEDEADEAEEGSREEEAAEASSGLPGLAAASTNQLFGYGMIGLMSVAIIPQKWRDRIFSWETANTALGALADAQRIRQSVGQQGGE